MNAQVAIKAVNVLRNSVLASQEELCSMNLLIYWDYDIYSEKCMRWWVIVLIISEDRYLIPVKIRSSSPFRDMCLLTW